MFGFGPAISPSSLPLPVLGIFESLVGENGREKSSRQLQKFQKRPPFNKLPQLEQPINHRPSSIVYVPMSIVSEKEKIQPPSQPASGVQSLLTSTLRSTSTSIALFVLAHFLFQHPSCFSFLLLGGALLGGLYPAGWLSPIPSTSTVGPA